MTFSARFAEKIGYSPRCRDIRLLASVGHRESKVDRSSRFPLDGRLRPDRDGSVAGMHSSAGPGNSNDQPRSFDVGPRMNLRVEWDGGGPWAVGTIRVWNELPGYCCIRLLCRD